LSPQKKKCLTRFAAAAEIGACCKRAKVAESTYLATRRQADQFGVLDQFEAFVGMKGLILGGPVKGGLQGEKFYLPTDAQWDFREQALSVRAEMAKARLRNPNLKMLPGYDQWFREWVIPPNRNGKQRSLPTSAPQRDPATESTESFISAKEGFAMTGIYIQNLSRLCRPGGPIRYRRPAGNRLEIHAGDLAAYAARRKLSG
jgi:hypothetical protein